MRVLNVGVVVDICKTVMSWRQGGSADKKPHLLTPYGGENEKIISQFSLAVPKAPAQRCYSYNIVIMQVRD